MNVQSRNMQQSRELTGKPSHGSTRCHLGPSSLLRDPRYAMQAMRHARIVSTAWTPPQPADARPQCHQHGESPGPHTQRHIIPPPLWCSSPFLLFDAVRSIVIDCSILSFSTSTYTPPLPPRTCSDLASLGVSSSAVHHHHATTTSGSTSTT